MTSAPSKPDDPITPAMLEDAIRCSALTPELSQQGEPVFRAGEPEARPPAVRRQRYDSHAWHRFEFYYYSTALPLITNDGYEDPQCAKSLLTSGRMWEDGSGQDGAMQMSAGKQKPCQFNFLIKSNILLPDLYAAGKIYCQR